MISNACAVIFVSLWEGACDRARLTQRLRAAEARNADDADDPATNTPG